MKYTFSVTDERGDEVLHVLEADSFDDAVSQIGLLVLTGRLTFEEKT